MIAALSHEEKINALIPEAVKQANANTDKLATFVTMSCEDRSGAWNREYHDAMSRLSVAAGLRNERLTVSIDNLPPLQLAKHGKRRGP